MEFLDYFSSHANLYAEFRPTYHDSLFQYLASICKEKAFAWDCATGNGQAAEGLIRHFHSVVASDGSRKQIQQAKERQRIMYFVALAEQPPLPDSVADLVTIAQALHWLKHEPFFNEINRVLKPDGIVTAWCYNLLEVDPAIDATLLKYYWEIVGPYWAPERRLLEQGYRTIHFPFVELSAPTFYVEADWNLENLIGYLRTWSATQKYMRVKNADPLKLILSDLTAAWGNPKTNRHIVWPLSLRIGRKKTPA
jgi:Methylase involved in ubiquinone/menaquinone biosynthesis